MSEKTCAKCGNLRPLDQFVKDSRNRSGRGSRCRECDRQSSSEWYESNKVRHGEYTSGYYESNKDKIREYQREYRERNADKLRQRKREYYLANKERLNAQMAEYYEKNAEKIAAYQAEYHKANRSSINVRAKKRRLERDDYVKSAESTVRKSTYRELKNQILQTLGGVCYCCGENNFAFLTIDHINNDGQLDRKPNGKSRNSYMILRDIWKAGCPSDRYRAACYNCNCARHQTPDKVCPHQSQS